MSWWKWLFGIGDVDAYYVPRMMYETLQHELAEAKRQLDESLMIQKSLAQKNKAAYYDQRGLDLLRSEVARLEERNRTLSSHNRFWEGRAEQLLGLLEYNNAPGSVYVRMPGSVCSSINQEALVMLHSRFKTRKDAM